MPLITTTNILDMNKQINIAALATYIQSSFEYEVSNPSEDMPTFDMILAMRACDGLFVPISLFASQIARTICDRMQMTEKQALCIAKGISECQNNFAGYLRFCPSDCFVYFNCEYYSE